MSAAASKATEYTLLPRRPRPLFFQEREPALWICLSFLAAVAIVMLRFYGNHKEGTWLWFLYAIGIWSVLISLFCFLFAPKSKAGSSLTPVAISFAGITLWTSPWMFAGYFLLPDSFSQQIIFLAVIFGLTIACAQSTALLFPAAVYLMLCSLLPIALRLLSDYKENSQVLGTTLILFLPVHLWLMLKLSRSLKEKQLMRVNSERIMQELTLRIQSERTMRQQTEYALSVAEKACMEKSRFLAAASHDLKQPIHAISLFVAALKAEAIETRSRYLVDRLDRSLAGLDELFTRLLDISHLDAGVIQSSRSVFYALPLAQTLETRFQAVAQSRALTFHVRCPAQLCLHSDPQLLTELISNLLSNAFRYTKQGGVLLSFRKQNNKILIQVWDTGCGIPESHLDIIFDEFVQLDNPARDRRKGLGLGLAIVKRLSTVLNHPVSVKSHLGQGSVFSVAVEEGEDQISTPFPLENADTLPRPVAGTLILVVEDEPDILAAMEAVLHSWGCYTILARSAEEAAKYIDNSPRFPDILITDHRLGNHVTSFDVVRALESQLPHPIPTIVISGEANASLEREVSAMGWHFLNKPVEAKRLCAAVCHALAAAPEIEAPAL